MDNLSDALSKIKNADRVGKRECTVKSSKLIKGVLEIMKGRGYIQDFEYVEDGRGGQLRVKLNGKINECGAIKPRFPVRLDEIEKYGRRYLPARDIGILIMSTPHGIMSHDVAREKRTGGILLAYVY